MLAGSCARQKRAISSASTRSVLVRESRLGGERFDGRRIDDADGVTCLMQKERERFAVSAGGFEAGVDSLDALAWRATQRVARSHATVLGKTLCLSLPLWLDETDIELEFGDVNAKYWFCHGGKLLSNQMAARVKLADTSSASGWKRLWILSDLCALLGMDAGSFSNPLTRVVIIRAQLLRHPVVAQACGLSRLQSTYKFGR